MNDSEFLLADLKNYLTQSSWDWCADERFAEHIGYKDYSTIVDCLNSGAPGPLRRAVSLTWKKPVTDRRLRVLRKLVGSGLVESYWVGTGRGGKSEFGVSRIRSYGLTLRGDQ